MSLQAIVGLGNPGSRYEQTRHNAGHWFIDRLARRWSCSFSNDKKLGGDLAVTGVGDDRRYLFKPSTYMNVSGPPVANLVRYYKLDTARVLVAYDELDLEPGVIRLKAGGGHGGHNGLRDLFAHLPATDFLRLRIGIGHPGHKDQVSGYVLSRARREEQEAIDSAIDRVFEVWDQIVDGDLDAAMNALHRRN